MTDPQAVWIGSGVAVLVLFLIGVFWIGIACRFRCKHQQPSSLAPSSDDYSIALRFFGGGSIIKEGASGGKAAVDQTESSSSSAEPSSGWESSDDDSSTSSAWSYNYSLKDKEGGAAEATTAIEDLETGAVPTITTPNSVSESQNNREDAAAVQPVIPVPPPLKRSCSLPGVETTSAAAIATESSYKTHSASFGTMARRILAGGSSRQSSKRDLDDFSIYSGSTLSIFAGSSVASEDAALHHHMHRHSITGAPSMPPASMPDAVSDWFAFKQEAGLHDEDTTESRRRGSCLEGKTLHPMRVQL